MDEVITKLSSLNDNIGNIHRKIDSIDNKISTMDAKFTNDIAKMGRKFADIERQVTDETVSKRLFSSEDCMSRNFRHFESGNRRITSHENMTTLQNSVSLPTTSNNDADLGPLSSVYVGSSNETILLNEIVPDREGELQMFFQE